MVRILHAARPIEAMTAPAPILFTHFGEEWIRGSERCLLDLLTHIDRTRYRPIVWCNAEALENELKPLDVTVHRSRFSILAYWYAPRWDAPNYVRQVRTGLRLVRQHGIRLLHSNSAAPHQWLLPVARTARLPLLAHLHAPYNRRDRFVLGLHQGTLAVGVSQGCVDGLVEDGMPRSRTKVIYNGVDPSLLGRGDARGLRQQLGIPADAMTIARVGSLIHRKGVDLMLQAFAQVRAVRPNSHLLIVGEGPERTNLEALARELQLEGSAHFLGLVSPAGAVLRDATDIAVSPSRGEGFGLTVIEAGVFGLPIVATNTTGMTEILTNGESGLIVPVGDVPALVRALLTMIDDPELRRRCGVSARATVEQRFLISRYVGNFEETYAELLTRPPEQLGWSGQWTSPAIYARLVASVLRGRVSGGTSSPEGALTPS